MSSTKHTVQAFDTELQQLHSHLIGMGELAGSLLVDALRALLTANTDLASKAVEQDQRIDEIEKEIEEEAVQLIARRQPLAVDLREIMAATRIASDLERIGDLAKNIAKRAGALGNEARPAALTERIRDMGRNAQGQLQSVFKAYVDRNAEAAIAIRNQDEELDLSNTAFFREAVAYIGDNPSDVAGVTHLIFCAKNIERIGDHVTNIAETVFYIVTGDTPIEERQKLDTSSLLPAMTGRDSTE